MCAVGFHQDELVNVEPLPATRALVSGIGRAVQAFSGVDSLPWVDIHVRQEPDHTESVENAFASGLPPQELERVASASGEMYRLWIDFFSDIDRSMNMTRGQSPRRRSEAGRAASTRLGHHLRHRRAVSSNDRTGTTLARCRRLPAI